MKRLHISLIKSFIGPFFASFFIAIFLLLMQFLWKYIDDLVGKGLDIMQIFQLLFYASARFVPLALPIGMLLSSVMVFGKLGENNELSALKSAGISFVNIFKPTLIFAILISFSSYLFSNYIMPIANLKNASMLYDIQKKKPALNIKEGIFYEDIDGFSLKIGKKSSNNQDLKDIIIYDHSKMNGNNKVISAKSGRMQLTKDERYLELILYDGHSYIDIINNKNKQDNPFRKIHFAEDLIRFDLSSFHKINNSEHLYKGHYAMLSNQQLKTSIDSLNQKLLNEQNKLKEIIVSNHLKPKMKKNYNKNTKKLYSNAINNVKSIKSIISSKKNNLIYKQTIITKHKIEWHRKISLAIACIIMYCIGAPLGALIKKGGYGLPVLVSTFFFLIYHVISIIGEKSAKELTIEAYQGIWITNLIFIPIAILLIYNVSNDMNIFNFYKLNLSIFAKKNK